MAKTMQNIVILMEPSACGQISSLKGGNMCLNRFCIEEDATFEVSGVYFLKKLTTKDFRNWPTDSEKGKGKSSLMTFRLQSISIFVISMNFC